MQIERGALLHFETIRQRKLDYDPMNGFIAVDNFLILLTSAAALATECAAGVARQTREEEEVGGDDIQTNISPPYISESWWVGHYGAHRVPL